jgi:hypothetical protein
MGPSSLETVFDFGRGNFVHLARPTAPVGNDAGVLFCYSQLPRELRRPNCVVLLFGGIAVAVGTILLRLIRHNTAAHQD